MWRALFLAIGLTACILGIECMMIDKAVLVDRSAPAPAGTSLSTEPPRTAREIVPPEWAPWSLLAGGAVVMLYSFTLPKKWSS